MIECAVINEGWPGEQDWPTIADRAVCAALVASGASDLVALPVLIEISLRLTVDDEIQLLNRDWRNKNSATNVLSFPMTSPGDIRSLPENAPEAQLGDIALALGVCTREAREKGLTLEQHSTHLIVHGTLHLLGFDHMSDDEAETMEAIERTALASIGLDDPYA